MCWMCWFVLVGVLVVLVVLVGTLVVVEFRRESVAVE